MTIGISPKVALPAIVQLVVGLVLIIIGLAAGDAGVRAIGLSIVASGSVTGALGYAAPAGAITSPTVGPSNDTQLVEQSPDAARALGLTKTGS